MRAGGRRPDNPNTTGYINRHRQVRNHGDPSTATGIIVPPKTGSKYENIHRLIITYKAHNT